MTNTYTYHNTTKTETLDTHTYIDMYTDPKVKETIHKYKFEEDIDARDMLIDKTIDMYIDTHLRSAHKPKTLYICTTPPSTMYERGEKKVDSMFELVRKNTAKLSEYMYTEKFVRIISSKVFTGNTVYMHNKKAQHLGNGRKDRVKDLERRYLVSVTHKLLLLYYLRIRKISHLSYTIIDDVSTTGSTLVACRLTLLSYLTVLKTKYPYISFDINIYSLSH